ncbi:MAG TPA: hypothetical protein ENO30_06300, partial [Thermodesulfobium narugense]|nr:hypothetical protein [Thermodesulfobium narugense]
MISFENDKIKALFTLKPMLVFPNNSKLKVFFVNKINMDTFTQEELLDYQNRIVNACYKLEPSWYKFITVGRRGYLKYPRTNTKTKNEFLENMEKYNNANWNIRQRNTYFVTKPTINDRQLIGEFTFPNVKLFDDTKKVGKEEYKAVDMLRDDIAYLFGGDRDNPFGETLYDYDDEGKWKYGFRLSNGRYGLVLINYGVGGDIRPFANDFLNYIDFDFLHLLHFQALDALTIEKKIKTTITLAEKTHMPAELIRELKDLEQKAILGHGNITQFIQFLVLFHKNKEKLIEYAYKVKSMSPYVLGFEGDIEFEIINELFNENAVIGKETYGIVRTSTLDYVATLFPASGRFNGIPEEPYIPLLNENLEPAYIPIDKSLFNIGTQGQMGAGKSVSLQYIATFFDMVIFVEKIQSDMGSYAIYAKYFDGDYIPLSLEIPVSINPLGNAYDYFTVDVYHLLEVCGVKDAYKEFDDGEREKLSIILDDIVERENIRVLNKRILLEASSVDDYLIRFRKLFEKL